MTDALCRSARERPPSIAIPAAAPRAAAVSLAAVLIAIFSCNDRAMSYRGLDLMLNTRADRLRDHRADVHPDGQRPRSLDRRLRRLVACIAGILDGGAAAALILLLAACIAAYAASAR
jgi:hypothetical protein